ncbi:hypothetical protein EC604_25295 [Paenibacillus amylolyticus]|jgi:hypothetical protein|uniref:Uncharacterized protein n=1 Tax=Paenibacillus amylolyticus TaxID=1451 RepID=A0A5M9WZY1_PAEAM|nr:hypothetical protein [Paenibacillus amylolyticus]KAA8787151.1 hypothetical protein EC604_25295 [Paenibacillus amylolyticus]
MDNDIWVPFFAQSYDAFYVIGPSASVVPDHFLTITGNAICSIFEVFENLTISRDVILAEMNHFKLERPVWCQIALLVIVRI